MAKFFIEFDRDACIGCGACAGVCPENWEFRGEKSNPIKIEFYEAGCNRKAEVVCPVGCIKVLGKEE